jgi:hypothetical protein
LLADNSVASLLYGNKAGWHLKTKLCVHILDCSTVPVQPALPFDTVGVTRKSQRQIV